MFERLREMSETKELGLLAGLVIASRTEFRVDWLQENDSVVLPQESAMHFNDAYAESLARAFENVSVGSLHAIPAEADGELDYFKLDASSEDLLAFSWECGSFDYLLLPDGDFPAAVLCTHNDYFLLAGPCSFICSFTSDPAKSQGEFIDFVEGHFEIAQPALASAMQYARGEWSATSCKCGH